MRIYHFPNGTTRVGTTPTGRGNWEAMPDIVINHVDEDLVLADELQSALQDQGWEVLFNPRLPVGRRLDEYLETLLPTTRCVVTLWSADSVGCPRVRDIANEALIRGVAVPVLADATPLPLGHRSVRTIDLNSSSDTSRDAYLAALIRAVGSTLDGASGAAFEDPREEQPSLSVRIARRVIEELTQRDRSVATTKTVAPDTFYVGPWQVDVGSNTLLTGNTRKTIQPRAMEVLVYLASCAPATVSVEEILQTVWKDRVVVDSAVHRCVSDLREALDDDARAPRFISTIPRRGYRVIAPVALTPQTTISQT